MFECMDGIEIAYGRIHEVEQSVYGVSEIFHNSVCIYELESELK